MQSQSFGFVLLVVWVLVPSCSQQNTSTQTASQPSTNSQTIPQKTFTAVTGAFGWNLGESLQSQRSWWGIVHKVETNKNKIILSYDAGRDSTILPIGQVIVCATKEGLIYSITGYIDPSQEEYANVKKGIIDALAEKYQVLPRYTPSKRYYEFGDKTNSVELEDCGEGLPPGSGLKLEYKHRPLFDAYISEVTKTMEEEKTKKEQAIKDSLKGYSVFQAQT